MNSLDDISTEVNKLAKLSVHHYNVTQIVSAMEKITSSTDNLCDYVDNFH